MPPISMVNTFRIGESEFFEHIDIRVFLLQSFRSESLVIQAYFGWMYIVAFVILLILNLEPERGLNQTLGCSLFFVWYV